jgi:hypothetical protein
MADAIEALPTYQAKKERCEELQKEIQNSVGLYTDKKGKTCKKPLEDLNNLLRSLDDQITIMDRKFEIPENLDAVVSRKCMSQQRQQLGEKGAQEHFRDIKQKIQSALQNTTTRQELVKYQTLSREADQIREGFSSLRASILLGKPTNVATALDVRIATNPGCQAAGITSYADWRQKCQYKESQRQHITYDIHQPILSCPNSLELLQNLVQDAQATLEFCQWSGPVEVAEKEIQSIRAEMGIKANEVPRSEMFATSGSISLQYGSSFAFTGMRKAVNCMLLAFPEEARERFIRKELDSFSSGRTPMDYVKSMRKVADNPSGYGLAEGFKLPDDALRFMDLVEEIDKLAPAG